MKLAFHPDTDTDCTITHAEGLDVTVEELESAYLVVRENVEKKTSQSLTGLVHPEEVFNETLRQIAQTFSTVQQEDIPLLKEDLSVPVASDLDSVVTQTFTQALSTLGQREIKNRPTSLIQAPSSNSLGV